jgi:hypothetical protein
LVIISFRSEQTSYNGAVEESKRNEWKWCETSGHFRSKKREHFRDKLMILNSKKKNVKDLYNVWNFTLL